MKSYVRNPGAVVFMEERYPYPIGQTGLAALKSPSAVFMDLASFLAGRLPAHFHTFYNDLNSALA